MIVIHICLHKLKCRRSEKLKMRLSQKKNSQKSNRLGEFVVC